MDSKKLATGDVSAHGMKPFGLDYLEELPAVPVGYGTGSTPPTSACTGLQTGGGDDPLSESECD